VVLWERATGKPVAPAIVWQDRRTADVCAKLRAAGHEPALQARTGLLLDPYFSATKIAWLLDNVAGLRARAERGELCFGTVDSYLVWRLSGGRAHVTDASNASRTLLLDLHTQTWSPELCDLFGVPAALLPKVVPSSGRVAETRGVPGIPDGTPIAGIAGDQQAALYGQGCFSPGDAKCTYGTGAFLLMNVGTKPVISKNRLLASVAWSLPKMGTLGGSPSPPAMGSGEQSSPPPDARAADTSFVLEGSAFVAGALVQWLRDGLGIISKAAEVEPLARSVPDAGGVVIVPALAGLGAPHWRAEARGLIAGITRGTTKAHIARAALEAIALQNVELVRAMEADSGRPLRALRVDGGAAANDLLMQIQADLLGVDVVRPAFVELTALGAARLAGRTLGWGGTDAPAATPTLTVFRPTLDEARRQQLLARWHETVPKA
jgi:glycerol kinase